MATREFDPDEPQTPQEARRLLTQILRDGEVLFSPHAKKEMANDQMDEQDAINVMRAGSLDPPEFEKGSWRYRVHTQRFCVVVAFDAVTLVVVVTAWRKK